MMMTDTGQAVPLPPVSSDSDGPAGTDRADPASAVPVPVDRRWEDVPCAALVLDRQGRIRAANRLARAIFPATTAGGRLTEDWLARAHRRFVTADSGAAPEVDSGWLDDRRFTAQPVPDPGGETVTWWLRETSQARRAEEELAAERRQAALLSQVSSALLTSLNLDRCMEIAAHLAATHLADAALVIGPAARGRHPAVRCARDGRPVRTQLRINPRDVPGLVEALQGFPPVPSRWIDPASAPDWLVPNGFGEVGAIVVTPLPGHGVPAGALILLRHAEHTAFSDEEEVFARLFAARSGAAMSAARVFAQQAAITETLTRDLLPPALRQLHGVEFAGRYRAAQDSERIGGDFYDIHPLAGTEAGDETGAEDGHSLVVLGDVCGKGLDAAVLTGKIRNTLRALLPMAGDHQRMLDRLNQALLNPHDARFVTLVLASAVRSGPAVRLRVTCAGHPPPLIVRDSGRVEDAPSRGSLIGVLPRIESTTTTVTLAPGETCLLYTDGITEARGGPLGEDMFGEQRLRQALTGCAGMPAEAVVEHVQMVAAQWIGVRAHDDMAVVAITAPRGQHLSAVGGHGRGRYTA